MMNRTIQTKRHKQLIKLVIAERKQAGMPQVQLAKRLKKSQAWVSRIESGKQRLCVTELLDLAEAVGFDALATIRAVACEP
jgi:transcriptional regulator with XRE-family HTH domain